VLSQLSSQGKEFGSVSHGLRDHACADWVRPKLIGLVPSYPAKSEDDQPSPSQAQKLNIRWVTSTVDYAGYSSVIRDNGTVPFND